MSGNIGLEDLAGVASPVNGSLLRTNEKLGGLPDGLEALNPSDDALALSIQAASACERVVAHLVGMVA